MGKDNRPYRSRVELVIWKNGKVLVTVNGEGSSRWYGLPGGGVDGDENLLEAVAREALEEVGIQIKNLRHTGEIGIKEGYKSAHADREAIYRGSETHLYEADYDKEDHRLLGKDGDAVPYEWMTPKQAHDLFKAHVEKNGGGSGNHSFTHLAKFL